MGNLNGDRLGQYPTHSAKQLGYKQSLHHSDSKNR